MKKTLISVSIALNVVFISFYIVLSVTSPKKSELHIQNWNEEIPAYIGLVDCFQGLDSTNVVTEFDNGLFLNDNAFIEPYDLEWQLAACDTSLAIHDTIIDNVVFNALGFEAFEICKDSLNLNHVDFLFKKLKWAEKFQNSSMMSTNHSLLFSRIADFWLQKILDQVQHDVEKNNNLKFSYDYRYVSGRLGENKYFSGVKNSDSEKFVSNLSEGNYFYLWTRLTQKSTTYQILLLLTAAVFLAVFSIGVFAIYKSLKRKINK